MRYVVLASLLAITLPLVGGAGTAKAQNVEFSVNDRHRDHWRGDDWRHRHWRGAYAYERGCRTVTTNRINGRGDRVTVRKRICG